MKYKTLIPQGDGTFIWRRLSDGSKSTLQQLAEHVSSKHCKNRFGIDDPKHPTIKEAAGKFMSEQSNKRGEVNMSKYSKESLDLVERCILEAGDKVYYRGKVFSPKGTFAGTVLEIQPYNDEEVAVVYAEIDRRFDRGGNLTTDPAGEEAPLFNKFKVEDEVVGNAAADKYMLTREGARGKVIALRGPNKVEVHFRLATLAGTGTNGVHVVGTEYFDLYEEPESTCKFKEEEKEKPTPRVHAELIKQRADDDSLVVDFKSDAGKWHEASSSPKWLPEKEYCFFMAEEAQERLESELEDIKTELKELGE